MSRVIEEPSTSRFGDATPGRRPPAPSPAIPSAEPESQTKRSRWRIVIALLIIVVIATGMVVLGRATAPGPGPTPLAVLTTTQAMPTGTKLTAADLVVVDVATPRSGHSNWLLASGKEGVIGQAAARPLPAGALLTPADVTTSTFPPAGQQLIGLELKGSEVPTGALTAGDGVTVVYVPAADQPPYPSPIVVTRATVWNVTNGQSGTTDVDVLVPTADAASLTAAAAHDEITLIRGAG
jgi:hypothetical protein